MTLSNSTTLWLALLILGLPLAGSMLDGACGPRLGRRFVNWVGPGSILLAFGVAVAICIETWKHSAGGTATAWTLLNLGSLNFHISVDFTVDRLAAVMCLVITGVGFLIHLYSVGYMAHDKGVARFFAYMNFFVFSMLLLVLAANLVILLIGWALVALSSYLLIGFWYERPSAVLAARKAFITQVIGDIALVFAAFMIVLRLHTLSMPQSFQMAGHTFGSNGLYVTGICLLLAVAAFAKSAQFPLHTWLPDAMEGPTPVSALIHAATMVTAGVYLIARFHAFFALSPFADDVVATVGMMTALMAGIIALSQDDIKRVIAYSTMSQIGLMIYAVGIGAYTAGMFHFATHAVFKALLFMAAGNVIHALDGEQRIRLMGGLRRRLWITYLCFFSGSLALAGVLFAGMFSKEDLLGFGFAHGGLATGLYFVGIAINVLTGLYTFRLLFTVFHQEPRTARCFAAKEAPPTMLVPVVILAVLAAVIGLIQWPVSIFGFQPALVSNFLNPVFGHFQAADPSGNTAWVAFAVGTLCSLIGVGAAVNLWEREKPPAGVVASSLPRFIPLLSLHAFYFDDIYDFLFVRPIHSVARLMRRVVEPRGMDGWVHGLADVVSDLGDASRGAQTGMIRDYASYFLGGGVVAVFVTYLVYLRAK